MLVKYSLMNSKIKLTKKYAPIWETKYDYKERERERKCIQSEEPWFIVHNINTLMGFVS